MDPAAYLERLDCAAPEQADAPALRRLHLAHLQRVPFENLDIHLKQPIRLELPHLYDKIVRRQRGGFCYELNGLFAWLLAELGYEVDLLSARVYGPQGPGPEFDHLTLRVRADGDWLADVGFGDSFLEPLPLEPGLEVVQRGTSYRLSQAGNQWTLHRQPPGDEWTPQYLFTLRPYQLEDFAPVCHFHQTDPASPFTRKRVCTRATPEGRLTLSEDRLISTAGPTRREHPVASEEERTTLLREHFGVVL
ncbi:MAG: arylamine N-acetyltransferase [Candidatus Latescibacteria bacterium]|nr:arylamine N-acetyltransferase [Candidatus Latescibacterota bacterium]